MVVHFPIGFWHFWAEGAGGHLPLLKGSQFNLSSVCCTQLSQRTASFLLPDLVRLFVLLHKNSTSGNTPLPGNVCVCLTPLLTQDHRVPYCYVQPLPLPAWYGWKYHFPLQPHLYSFTLFYPSCTAAAVKSWSSSNLHIVLAEQKSAVIAWSFNETTSLISMCEWYLHAGLRSWIY